MKRALTLAVVLCAGCATPKALPKLDETHAEVDVLTVRHTVQPGQTLYRIARAYGVTVDAISETNGIEDPTQLRVGQELWIPGAKENKAVPEYDAPEPTPPSRTLPPEVKKPPRVVEVGRKDGVLSWPLKGVLYARFGRKGKEPHDGIDLAAPAATPVMTAGPGNVLFAGEQKGYGLIVIIEHDNGLVTLYAHNRDVRVKTNQKVRAGQVVATVGDSGRTSGPHLHFEVRKDGLPVDPLEYLGPVPK